MNATAAGCVVGIDVAKSVFQLAVADHAWHVTEQHRLTRAQMERWFVNRAVDLVVMEACGSARHWALDVQGRTHHNKAACALANKLARICYATLRDGRPYGEPARRPDQKIERMSFAMAL